MDKRNKLSSINHLHEAGCNERKAIVGSAGVIFLGGFVLWMLVVVLLIGPAWLIRTENHLPLPSRVFEAFSLLALEPAGMAPFVAIAGVVLAINRIDRHSPDEMGVEDAVRLWTRLDFRAIVQLSLIMVAATAPYRAITWVLLNTSEVDWSRQMVANAGSCLVLWLLLLLAGPTGTFFGLQGIQRKWQLVHVLHKAGLLERAWGQRWGRGLYSDAKHPWLLPRTAINWISIIVSAMVFVLVTTAMTSPGYQFWADPQYSRLLIVVAVYLAICGLFGLAVSVAFASLSLRLGNEGRTKASRIFKSFACSIPLLFIGGTAAAFGTPYLPVVAGILFIGWVQFSCARTICQTGCIAPRTWSPGRCLALNIVNLSHQQARNRYLLLQAHWSSGIDRLPRREAKRATKEAREWRANHHLLLPFLD